jgi:hypothetical protein
MAHAEGSFLQSEVLICTLALSVNHVIATENGMLDVEILPSVGGCSDPHSQLAFGTEGH